ncbi:MAG: biotin--[Kiritimatiellae bacterium]|nr:biotin--[acetyl-CoA-carboxylase] ligase [Kiritimatiellia bacterium]
MTTIADQILELLKADPGAEVSSATICGRCGVTRTAIWKWIERLRESGYVIEARSRHGYRLVSSPDTPSQAEVFHALTTKRIGRDFRYREVTGSTNRDAMALISQGVPEGTVVVAGEQTSGRGRMTRNWFSPPGKNLYFSLVLRPLVEFSRAASMPLVVGLAVAEALASLAPELDGEIRIKWPNDILIGGKKICGILCELQAEEGNVVAIVPGIGVNVNLTTDEFPEELRPIATALQAEAGHTFSRSAVLATILNRLEPLYETWMHEGLVPLLPAIKRRDALFGRQLTIDRLGQLTTGTADGIQDDGALRLRTTDGIVPIYSGEAHILGVATAAR